MVGSIGFLFIPLKSIHFFPYRFFSDLSKINPYQFFLFFKEITIRFIRYRTALMKICRFLSGKKGKTEKMPEIKKKFLHFISRFNLNRFSGQMYKPNLFNI